MRWVVACGQRLPQVSDPSSLAALREGTSAGAAGRFEAASDLLLKRPCFLPPVHFFLVPLLPLSTSGLGVSCSLGREQEVQRCIRAGSAGSG